MSEPKAPPGGPEAPTTGENQAMRGRVRELTSELLRRRRLDTEGMEVMRAMPPAPRLRRGCQAPRPGRRSPRHFESLEVPYERGSA